MSRNIIFFAPSFPNPISTFLAEHGYDIFEAESIPEVLRLSENHSIDAVVVAPGSDNLGLLDIQQRCITVNLTIHAAAPEVFLELSNLLAGTPQRIQ
jgi:hypothetical protein